MIFAGVPINVTMLFSREHDLAAGLNLAVCSVASVFIGRWDKAVAKRVPTSLRNALGIAVAKQTSRAYRDLINSPRYGRPANAGARPQRLLRASSGTKDPDASDVLDVKALQAPFTINTMPEETLTRLTQTGVDVGALAAQLQQEGTDAFVQSWNEPMALPNPQFLHVRVPILNAGRAWPGLLSDRMLGAQNDGDEDEPDRRPRAMARARPAAPRRWRPARGEWYRPPEPTTRRVWIDPGGWPHKARETQLCRRRTSTRSTSRPNRSPASRR